MIAWEKSKEHFQFIRSRSFTRTENGLDYWASNEGGNLYIVFQESQGADDWAADLNFFPENFDIYPGSKIKAHRGLALQYFDIRERLMKYLYSGVIKHIYIAGFSLGGAITTAAVEDIGFHIDRDKLDVAVYGISYDGPRFFGPSKIVKQAVKDRLDTVKNRFDPVVHLPFKVMPTWFYFRWEPLKFYVDWKWLLKGRLTFWKDYGKIFKMGNFWPLPCKHNTEEMEKSLLEKFGH
jgi:hypothetical protein